MRQVRDHYLPPDHDAFIAAEPATGRVIVIAPTRAACETIELAMHLRLDTLLEREHGPEIRALAAAFHAYYSALPFIVADDALRNARLAVIVAARQVIRNALDLLGVSAPESM